MRVGLVVAVDLDYGLDLTNALHEAGAEVCLYLSQKRAALHLAGETVGSVTTDADYLSKRFYQLGLVPPACDIRIFRFPRMRDPRSLMVVQQIRDAIRNDAIDVVHILMGPAELWIGILANLLQGIPVVSTMIIPNPNIGESLPRWLMMGINRLLVRGSDLVIVNGLNQVEEVQKPYRIPSARVSYVPLAPRMTARKWLRGEGTEEAGTVLFAGRAHPHKGLEYLVRAQPLIARQIPEARILLAVHGSELERCRRFMKEPDKFEIHEGYFEGSALAGFFARSSLVVLPYLSASTSGILVTAYVFGKPVVASRVGCLPEYVQDEVTGLLVPPADPAALADAIARLLADNVLRHQMGRNAREWAVREQRRVATLSLEVYAKALALVGNSSLAAVG